MISTLTDYGDRQSWLSARSQGIGASESAALFGVSRWDTIYSLWAKKVGRLIEQNDERSKLLKWGLRLEPAIAAGYEEDSGRRVARAGQYAVGVHPSLPFMTATPDYFIIEAHDRDGAGLLEVKNVGIWMEKDWADGIPDYVQIQAQHQMACLGSDYVVAMPLFGGNDDRPMDIERNQAFIDELEEQCKWFWSFVTSGEAPPVDGSLRTLEAIKKLHPKDNGNEIVLPPEALDWWGQLEHAKAEIKSGEERKTDAECRLKDAIGDATFGRLPDGRRLSLKTSSNPGHETIVGPYTYRTLRIEKAKKGSK